MRIDRMLAITVMLLNRDRISARELADKFEVSVRTIYRDIESINLAGIPIVAYQGNNGGFGIMENYKIDRQVLTLNDMIAIISALKGISATLDYRELDGAIEKISSLVPADRADHGPGIDEQLVIDILPWGYRKRQRDLLQKVHQSIQERRLLEMEYGNMRRQRTRRTVEPMTLIYKGFAWYLFGFCRLKQDYRLFRLSRISDLNILDENFVRREKTYREVISPDLNPPSMISLVLKFPPEMRTWVEDYFMEEEIERRTGGDLIVRASLPEDDWILSMILSYGEHVEVLEPAHLREKIREKAEKIYSLYET